MKVGNLCSLILRCILHTAQHCDDVIMNEYTGMSGRGEGRSVEVAQIDGEVVEVQPAKNLTGLTLWFDKNPIVGLEIANIFELLFCTHLMYRS